MACGNSANKISSFLSLVKEEPVECTTSMEVSSRPIPLSMGGHPTAPPTVVTDPQMQQPLPLSQINSSNLPSQRGGIHRGEIDPNFEPVSRGRSNTWPLPCPEGFIEGDEVPSMTEPSTSGEQNRIQGSAPSFVEAIGGGQPKKNTSRRNPWGNMSYADLIAQAILSSPEGRATLSQIYDWMVQNVPYFKDKGDSNSSAGWKNSIRHNLSLHSRFMRMQNEGTGKSSWWVLNPDAKPGKSTRRRANTLEGAAGRLEKKRGRMRKKVDVLRNGLEPPVSPSEGALEFYPASPSSGPVLHSGFQLSPQDYRPRASSNASSCGRLSPIPAVESDMHDSQVPPVSPGVAGWGPDYWSANNHIHGAHPPHLMGRHPHEHFADQLVDSIGEGLNLGTRENWPPLNGMTHHNGTSSDCMKMHNMHAHPMNGFMSPHHLHNHHQGFGSYEDFSRYGAPNPLTRGYQPPLHEKTNQQRHVRHFQVPPLQNVSPAHSLSPPNGVGDGPSFSSPPQSHHHSATQNHLHTTSSTSHHNPSSNQHHTTPPIPHQGPSPTSGNSPLTVPISSHNQHQSPSGHPQDQQPSTPESTAMLRVAFSHREASSCAHNTNKSGTGMGHSSCNSQGGVGDLSDLDAFQGGLECNVEEHGQNAYNHGHAYATSHSNSSSQLSGTAGPSSVVQVYSCASIQTGNHWVR